MGSAEAATTAPQLSVSLHRCRFLPFLPLILRAFTSNLLPALCFPSQNLCTGIGSATSRAGIGAAIGAYAGAQWGPTHTLESLLWPLCEAARVAVGRPVGTDMIGQVAG